MSQQLPIFPLQEHKRTPRAIKKHQRGVCCTPLCRNSHRKGGWFCGTCVEREYRWKDPVRAIWRDHKQNAIKRDIKWKIPLPQFRIWIFQQVGFIDKRGNFADAWTIDRKRSDKHYTLKNIWVMSRRINSYKEAFRRKFGHAAEAQAFEQFTNEQLVGDLEEIRKALPLHQPVNADDDPPF